MHAMYRALPLLALVLTASMTFPVGARVESQTDLLNQKLAEGIQALESRDFDRAADAFREVLNVAPDSEPALLGLSEALAHQGNPLAALALARQAQEIAPHSAPAALAVARHLAQLDASDQALEVLGVLRALDPQEIQGYLFPALLLRNLGRGDEAIKLLEQALELGVREPRLEEELALLLIAADRPGEAQRRAQEALARYGETAGLQLALGLAMAATDSQDKSEAISRLGRALELGAPEPGKVQLEIGSLLIAAGRAAEAIELLTQAAELEPDSPEVFYKLGAAQRATGDTAGARESLSRFQELKAGAERQERLELEIGTSLNEAQTLASSNRLAEALERLDRLLQDHPDEARVHTLRAKVLYSLRRQGEALAAIERSRQLDPTQIEPNYLEGMFLLHMNRPAEARVALLRAVSLDPQLGEAYVLLGGAAAKLDHPAEAAAYFERALELGADSPSLRLGYSAVLESLGRLEESAQQDEAYRRLVQPPQ